MLASQEWQKIKAELKKNIEPLFRKADIELSVPFEELVDIFQGTLEKKDIDSSINGRDDIETLLQKVYVEGNIKLGGSTLDVLSGKLEGYLKKVFKIANQPLQGRGRGMLAQYLKTIFRVFHTQKNHPNFSSFTEQYISSFFNRNDTNYNKPEFFITAHKLGSHFKIFYTSRNEEGHLYKEMGLVEIFNTINSILVTYLYITNLYAETLKQKTIHQPDYNTTSNWSIFKQYCRSFQKNQSYFLITDRLNINDSQLFHFLNIKWDFIFDFDIKSEIDGLYAVFQDAGTFPQVINQIVHTSDDRGRITATFPANTTFWYFVQGHEGRTRSLVDCEEFADWRTRYSRYTEDLMIKYYEKKYSFSHNPIKVIILSKEVKKVEVILYAIKEMNPKLNIEFIFANEDNSILENLRNDISGKSIDLPLSTLVEGLRKMEGEMYSSSRSNKIYLPSHSSKGKSIELPNDTILSVQQYFQIIHLGILNENNEQVSAKTFYQGRAITWQELNEGDDIGRTITKDLVKAVKNALEKRVEGEIIYLTHYAGVGGSTVAKRVAFEIYTEFPVLFLNETISNYDENLLVEKLLKIFQATDLPSLVVVDNTNVTNQQIEMLERVTANRLAKTVFLLVESTFSDPKNELNRFYMPATLDKKEAELFVKKFSKKYEKKAGDFRRILTENNINTLNAFYFGLIATEDEYISVNKYVERRIEGITDSERKLLLLLAFCQIYGKGSLREVPHFVISTFLEIDEEYIRLKKHTQNHKIHDLIIETDNLSWKIIHPIIAQTILEKVVGIIETGSLDPYKLKDFAINLIKSLRTISDHENEEVLELLHSLFIRRDDEDNTVEIEETDDSLYNKRLFSKFINDLENNNNRIEVFENLTREFPHENAHFWGHFSRLYSINKDFDKALEKIDKALDINTGFVFYHIKGMCYRTELYRLKDICWGKKEKANDHSSQMKAYFDKASEAFKTARNKAPQKEYGYITFIQMVSQMIEFEHSISRHKTQSKDYTEFIKNNAWCRDILTKANEVVNDYKDSNQEFENPRIEQLQIQLLKFFGVPKKMINAWNGLLGNKKYDQNTVRRQLAYAYLAKNKFDWKEAKRKDLNRIIENIEENLRNKVEVRDLILWFKTKRRLTTNVNDLIKKVGEWDLKKPSLDTAYFLMCLFGIQAIIGDVKSGIDNYGKYKMFVRQRIVGRNYSKVFCIEWLGSKDNHPILLNRRQLGEWAKEKQFFKIKPSNLLKLKGKVVNYTNRGIGYIEINNVGIKVMYQPAKFDHFSDDAQKGTQVEFYLGFNYDGARAFEVKNI